MRLHLLPLFTLASAAAFAQPVDFTDLETARAITSGPPSGRTSSGSLTVEGSRAGSSVGAGRAMRFGMNDELERVTARAPGGLTLILSRSSATFQASGTLPVSARASVDVEGHAQGTGRLKIDSKDVIDDLVKKIGGLPLPTGGVDLPGLADGIPDTQFSTTARGRADGTFHAEGSATNIRASAEIGKKTQGVLVGIPIVGGLSFFGGAKKVDEYVVVAVQGFDYEYSYRGQATASVTPDGGLPGASTSQSTSGGKRGHVATPGLSMRKEWSYTVAVVGIGYRGEKGGFHAVVDLDWSAPKIDPDGFVDVGPLKQLQMPGPVRDAEIGGDFRVGGFSAGANVKLFTFAGYAAGAGVDMFVSQEFSALSIGLSYHGQARGLMADQSAALEIAFKPADDVRVTLIGGVRVMSSYVPGINQTVGKDFGREKTGDFGGSTSNVDYAGSYRVNGRASGEVVVDQPETWRHNIQYAPGLRVDLLSRGVSIEGGPILDHRGKPIGGRGGLNYEIVPDRMEIGAGVHSTKETGTGGSLNLGVSF